MSATFAPERSLSGTPSSAGIQDGIRLALYPGRKNCSQPMNTSPSGLASANACSCVIE